MSLEHTGVCFAKVNVDQVRHFTRSITSPWSTQPLNSVTLRDSVVPSSSHMRSITLRVFGQAKDVSQAAGVKAMPTFKVYVDGEASEDRTVQGWNQAKIEALLADVSSSNASKED